MAGTNEHSSPPPVLGCARLLHYAVLDNGIEFSGHSLLFVNGKELGAVPALAICEDIRNRDVLLFHCATDWRVLGCSAHPSVADAQSRAERIYHGVTSRWVAANVPRATAEAYLDELFEGKKCTVCGKRPYEVDSLVQRGSAWVCNACADNLR